MLLWAMGLAELEPYDRPFDAEWLLATPTAHGSLRAKAEIEHARETARLWHWRARTDLLRAGDSVELPADWDSFEQLIAVAAMRGYERGLLPVAASGRLRRPTAPATGSSHRGAANGGTVDRLGAPPRARVALRRRQVAGPRRQPLPESVRALASFENMKLSLVLTLASAGARCPAASSADAGAAPGSADPLRPGRSTAPPTRAARVCRPTSTGSGDHEGRLSLDAALERRVQRLEPELVARPPADRLRAGVPQRALVHDPGDERERQRRAGAHPRERGRYRAELVSRWEDGSSSGRTRRIGGRSICTRSAPTATGFAT